MIVFHRMQFSSGSPTEYLGDSIYLGLREVLGDEVIDIPKIEPLYNAPRRTFTFYGNLTDSKENILKRSHPHYLGEVNKLIITLHHTTDNKEGHIKDEIRQLKKHYCVNDNDVVILDGADSPKIYESLTCFKYFKRELQVNRENVYPISFALPLSKLRYFGRNDKSQDFASLIPAMSGNSEKHYKTYVYEDEESYYHDYAKSYFAITCKKGGWDCARHLEILANSCVPYFLDFESCPKNTLFNYPKDLLAEVLKLPGITINCTEVNPKTTDNFQSPPGFIDWDKFDLDKYWKIQKLLYRYTKENLVGTKVAHYLLNKIGYNS